MKPDIKNVYEDVKKAVRGFFLDFKRLAVASKSTALLVFFVYTFLGLFPLLELVTLYGLIDALIGARAVGISTKDVTTFMWYQIGLFILLIPAVFFSSQFSGMTNKIGRSLREIFLAVTLFLAALPAAPILLFVLLVGAFFIRYIPFRFAPIIYSFVVLLLMSRSFSTILDVTIHRGATVGQAVLLGGSLMLFSVWLALRPYLNIVDNR